jgi:hypothetical protein
MKAPAENGPIPKAPRHPRTTTETSTTMKIQVNSDSSVNDSNALHQTVDRAIRAALDRYSDRIPRAEVHLSADDASDRHDPDGSRCQLETRPAGMELVVTGTADTVERACHDAARKMQGLLESTFGRTDSHSTGATIRKTAAERARQACIVNDHRRLHDVRRRARPSRPIARAAPLSHQSLVATEQADGEPPPTLLLQTTLDPRLRPPRTTTIAVAHPTSTTGEIPRSSDLSPAEFLADLEVAVTNRMRDPLDQRAE